MRRMKWISTLLCSAILCGVTAFAQSPGHNHGGHGQQGTQAKARTGPHGGQVQNVGAAYCEVVFEPKSVRVYLFDTTGQPISVRGARGSVSMKVTGNPKSYRYDLHPDATQGAESNSLLLAIDLSKIPDGGMTTSFSITGAPGTGRSRWRSRNRFI